MLGIADSFYSGVTLNFMSNEQPPKDKKNKADRHNARGIQLADRGWLEEAVKEFSKAIDADPNASYAMDNLGTVYSEKGMRLEALQSYIKSIAMDENPKDAYFNLASFLLHHSKHLALDLLKQVAQKDWNFPDVHGQTGFTLAELGHPTEAMEAYKIAIELNPADIASRQELASLYMTFGRLVEAIKELKRVLTEKPDHMEAWVDLGVCYHLKGLLSEAKKALLKGLEYDPDHSHALLRLAALLADEQRDDECFDILQRIFAKDGEIARVWAENDPAFHRLKKHSRWLSIFLNSDPREGKDQNENQEA